MEERCETRVWEVRLHGKKERCEDDSALPKVREAIHTAAPKRKWESGDTKC